MSTYPYWMEPERRAVIHNLLLSARMTAQQADEVIDLAILAVREAGAVIATVAERAASPGLTAQVIMLTAQLQHEVISSYITEMVQFAADNNVPTNTSRPV